MNVCTGAEVVPLCWNRRLTIIIYTCGLDKWFSRVGIKCKIVILNLYLIIIFA